MSTLGLGKVTREVFNRCVLPHIPIDKEIEIDGAIIKLGENTVIAHSPSIGVPIEALGFFAFHYSASNVAAKFGKPMYLITGIYLPLKTTEEELRIISKGLGDEAKKFGVNIIAGQTATYFGIDIPLLTATCLGESIREQGDVNVGDKILLIGDVGGEALWLESISRGSKSNVWSRFTPLQTILALQTLPGIKVMHDISEGGVKGALLELSESLGYGLEVRSTEIKICPGAEKLQGDIYRAPTYGTLIVLAKESSIQQILNKCVELGKPCSNIGEVKETLGLIFDEQYIKEQERVELDTIYGRFKPKDPLIEEVEKSIEKTLEINRLSELIPEVGMNIVYAKQKASTINDVAGLSGRIVNASGKPILCGNIAYGASRYLSTVVLEAIKINKLKRAALNLRGGDDIRKKIESLGLKIIVLPKRIEGEGCPVTLHLKKVNEVADAYIHPGDFGVEPTTTIIGESPIELVNVIEKLVKLE